MLRLLLLVCAAGALGSGTRFLTTVACERILGPSFPWGTLTVNLAGSFLISFVAMLAVTSSAISEPTRITISTGFLGGLTTYSSFNYDTVRFVESRAYGVAAAYVLVTLIGCLAAGFLGMAVGRR